MAVTGKKIECYIDCVSPYSYYALTYLRENKAALEALGVEVEFIPVFLGGINVGSGNKPPWTLPQKAKYSPFDGKRAQKYFGHSFEVPSFFPILSLLPQRAMTYVKQQYDSNTFECAFLACFHTMWDGGLDISKPENLSIALLKAFKEDQAREIIEAAAKPEVKEALTNVTAKAVKELGAFGCPWFWVHDGKGNAEPFFGSDRFHFMWEYLDLPHRKLQLGGGAKL